mmetsp:Transcript_10283/g.31796  ORF Transcript_10283/g.31796 Transcript_10283/m.31796 type:complete len:252 (-) Transcript_10283:190-945(-)
MLMWSTTNHFSTLRRNDSTVASSLPLKVTMALVGISEKLSRRALAFPLATAPTASPFHWNAMRFVRRKRPVPKPTRTTPKRILSSSSVSMSSNRPLLPACTSCGSPPGALGGRTVTQLKGPISSAMALSTMGSVAPRSVAILRTRSGDPGLPGAMEPLSTSSLSSASFSILAFSSSRRLLYSSRSAARSKVPLSATKTFCSLLTRRSKESPALPSLWARPALTWKRLSTLSSSAFHLPRFTAGQWGPMWCT